MLNWFREGSLPEGEGPSTTHETLRGAKANSCKPRLSISFLTGALLSEFKEMKNVILGGESGDSVDVRNCLYSKPAAL